MPECVKGAKNEQRIVNLEEHKDDTKTKLNEIYVLIDEVKRSLLGRPHWLVVVIITALVGLSSSLLTVLLRIGH